MAMLALLAWLGTHIFWTLTAKETRPPLAASPATETDPRKIAQVLAARHVFGEVPATQAVVAAPPIDYKLSGVIAAQKPGQTAMAFLVPEGKPAIAVREGSEVAPGVTLSRVLPGQVELVRDGQPQVVTLPEPNKAAAQAGKPPQAAAPAAAGQQASISSITPVAQPAASPSSRQERPSRFRSRPSYEE